MRKFKPNHFINSENVAIKILSSGKNYSVRASRERYFFPDEWLAFYDGLKDSQKLTFNFLINTGARINEIRNVKVGDIDFSRNSVILRITKTKNPDGSKKVRVIPISSKFTKYLKGYIAEKNLKPEDYLGVLTTSAANVAMKKTLQLVGIKDWKMFSVHNVRKTIETWLLSLDVDGLKITKHFGHSIAIAAKHYISAETFNFQDKQQMREAIGDLYLINK